MVAITADKVVVELEAKLNKYMANVKQGEMAFGEFVSSVEGDIQRANKALGGLKGPPTAPIQKANLDTANLAAQLNDIGVTLAGGMNPFMIAIQQGTQINQVLGQRGAAGAVSALGKAFTSLLTPVSLATLAIIGLGGYAIQYLAELAVGTEKADDNLKKHAKLIEEIKSSYGVAIEGLTDYSAQSKEVLETLARDSISRLKINLGSELEDLFGDIGGMIGYRGNQEYIATSIFRPFEDAILRLREGFKNGEPDVKAFRDEIARIANTTSDETIRKLAKELLDATEDANNFAAAISTATDAISALNSMAGNVNLQGLAEGLAEYGKAIDNLNKIAAKDDERTKAAWAYNEAITAARGNIELENQALEAYQQTLQRIQTEEDERENKRLQRRSGKENEFERELRQLQERTRLAELETKTLGLSQFERDKALIAEQLTNAALQARIPINEQLIEQEASKGAAALEALRKAEEGAQALNDLMQTFGDHATDTFLALVDGTKKWNEALADTLKLLARMLAQAAFTGGGPLGQLLGLAGEGGNVGGLFGMLSGKRAGGGSVQQNKPYLVGEQGAEVMVPGRSGTVIPNHRLSQTIGGAGSGPTIINNNDFRGVIAEDRVWIEQQLARRDEAQRKQPQTTSEIWRRQRPALRA